jgi:hypothetical protein
MDDVRDRMIEILHGVLDGADRDAFESFLAEDPILSLEWKSLRQAASRLAEIGDFITLPLDLGERTYRRLIQFRDSPK